MRIDALFPQEFPGLRIQRINVGSAISKHRAYDRIPVTHRFTRIRLGPSWGRPLLCPVDRDRRSHLGRRLELPACAARFLVERIDRAIVAPNEERAARGRRLGTQLRGFGKSDDPGDLEARDLLPRQTLIVGN